MKWKVLSLIIFSLALPHQVFSQDEQIPLVVHVKNFNSDNGNCVLRVYRETDNIPKHFFKQFTVPIIHGEATLNIDSLSFGKYAIIAFHDVNSNNEIDHSLGFPSEPLGFSNGWRLSLFSGMPNFKKLMIVYSREENAITIILD